MKAITLHQPHASLVAFGVKAWETRGCPPNGPMRPEGVRGLPGLAIEPGERIAIHASAKHPRSVPLYIDQPEPATIDAVEWPWTYYEDPGDYSRGAWRWTWAAGLGAVAATARVVEVLPIVEGDDWLWGAAPLIATAAKRPPNYTSSAPYPDLIHVPGSPATAVDISDQIPYGDWAPGRWAWRLADVEPLTSPIPCKGRQGVWRLPDDTVRQLQEARP
ncbi:MAG: hypothetical protein KTQ12_10425 [Dermatophilaceae bacterium]|nr:hypothetical protein [Dermatophilaceae bacterium]